MRVCQASGVGVAVASWCGYRRHWRPRSQGAALCSFSWQQAFIFCFLLEGRLFVASHFHTITHHARRPEVQESFSPAAGSEPACEAELHCCECAAAHVGFDCQPWRNCTVRAFFVLGGSVWREFGCCRGLRGVPDPRNRRVGRTAAEYGIRTTTLYTDPDANSQHALSSPHAVNLGEPSEYLNGDRIIQIAKEQGCQGIHPGYGFVCFHVSSFHIASQMLTTAYSSARTPHSPGNAQRLASPSSAPHGRPSRPWAARVNPRTS